MTQEAMSCDLHYSSISVNKIICCLIYNLQKILKLGSGKLTNVGMDTRCYSLQYLFTNLLLDFIAFVFFACNRAGFIVNKWGTCMNDIARLHLYY